MKKPVGSVVSASWHIQKFGEDPHDDGRTLFRNNPICVLVFGNP
jgi:hypothetical protein